MYGVIPCGALFVVALIAGALAGGRGEDDARPEVEPTGTTAATISSSTTVEGGTAPSADLSECTAASGEVVGTITAALTEEGATIEHAFAIDDDGRSYVSADIVRPDGMVEHAEVWLIDAGTTYSLSSDARSNTSLPDGRDLEGLPSAGDEPAVEAMDCTTAAGQAAVPLIVVTLDEIPTSTDCAALEETLEAAIDTNLAGGDDNGIAIAAQSRMAELACP